MAWVAAPVLDAVVDGGEAVVLVDGQVVRLSLSALRLVRDCVAPATEQSLVAAEPDRASWLAGALVQLVQAGLLRSVSD